MERSAILAKRKAVGVDAEGDDPGFVRVVRIEGRRPVEPADTSIEVMVTLLEACEGKEKFVICISLDFASDEKSISAIPRPRVPCAVF